MIFISIFSFLSTQETINPHNSSPTNTSTLAFHAVEQSHFEATIALFLISLRLSANYTRGAIINGV